MTVHTEPGEGQIDLLCFADESSDGASGRVFAVAGLMGPDVVWERAEREWTAITEGKVFHATEFETQFARDPDPAKHKQNLAAYAKLVRVIANSDLLGYGIAFDTEARREFFPGDSHDVDYYKCCTHFIAAIAKLAGALASQPVSDVFQAPIVQFVFDNRAETAHNVRLMYESFVSGPDWAEETKWLSRSVRFDDRRNPRIQMADLVARETMKELERTLVDPPRNRRKSMIALASTNGRLAFDILTRDYVESLHAQAKAFDEAMQREHNFSIDGYRVWLGKNRAGDNWSNRFRYLSWHNVHSKP